MGGPSAFAESKQNRLNFRQRMIKLSKNVKHGTLGHDVNSSDGKLKFCTPGVYHSK